MNNKTVFYTGSKTIKWATGINEGSDNWSKFRFTESKMQIDSVQSQSCKARTAFFT